jgi:hypothetical protein
MLDAACIVEAEGDEVSDALLAHVGEIHRRAGFVALLCHGLPQR